MDDEIQRFLKEELKKEDEKTMKEVENDPNVMGLKAPEELHDHLFAQIRQYEEEKEKKSTYENLPEEYKQLVDLGMVYRKRQKYRKYVALATVLTLTMVCGVTSIGGPERVFKEIKWMMGGREQVNIDSEGEDILTVKEGKEEDAYQKIKDDLGFDPVRMNYLPEEIKFTESAIDIEAKMAQLIYEGSDKKSLIYQMNMNYKQGSLGFDVEDKLLDKFIIDNSGSEIEVKQYGIQSTNEHKWIVRFEHKGIQYFMAIHNVKKGEIEKILKNLYFF